MKIILTLVFNGILIVHLYGQGLYIKGFVYDSLTSGPLPFANISIENSTIGTITNSKGYYSLKIPGSNKKGKLTFSFIGYKTKSINLDTKTDIVNVFLVENTFSLSEVNVYPDSNMFTLLRKAYERIPQNYSTNPSKLSGFYREVLQQKGGAYLYISEAVINSYLTSYKNRQTGQVEIVKSRKNILPQIDTIFKAKAYGGLFIVHDNDIVHNRDGAINPRNFKKYQYEYLGIKEYGNRFVYAFSFSDTNSDFNLTGSFYIDTRTLAYVYYDYQKTGNWMCTLSYNYKTDVAKILYDQIGNVWYLRSVTGKNELFEKQTRDSFEVFVDYLTTGFNNDNIKPLEFGKQAKYTDIFSDLATSYDDSYWKDYPIFEQDSLEKSRIQLQFTNNESAQILSQEHKKTKTFLDYYFLIFSHLYVNYALCFNDYSFRVQNAQIEWKNYSSDIGKLDTKQKNLGLSISIGYKITQKIGFEFGVNKNKFNNIYFENLHLGANYLIPLKRIGRQIYIIPNIAYSYTYGGYMIGQLDLENPTRIKEEKFNSGKINIYSGKKYNSITTGINIKTNLNHFINFLVGFNYYIPFSTNDAILFKEEKGFYKRKAYQKIDDNIEYYEDGERKYTSSFKLNNWNISAGIRVEL
jgi:hypothetical protein